MRAVLEGVAFGLRDSLDLDRRARRGAENWGASPVAAPAARCGLQIIASVLELPLERVAVDEGAAFGAAILGGVAADVWPDVHAAVEATVKPGERIEPRRRVGRALPRAARAIPGAVPGAESAQVSGPIASTTAASTAPDRTSSSTSASSGDIHRSGPGPGTRARSTPKAAAVPGAGRKRRAQVEPARRARQLDRDDPRQVRHRQTELARRSPAHRHVVLLHRARRQRVDARRRGQPAVLGHQRRLRVLRRSSAPSRRPGSRPGTAAARATAWRPAAGRSAARRSRRPGRPRSRGSRTPCPRARRGSSRTTRRGRPAKTIGLSIADRSSTEATP